MLIVIHLFPSAVVSSETKRTVFLAMFQTLSALQDDVQN